MLNKILSLTCYLLFGLSTSFSQSILAPNVGLKSHETLDILKVVLSESGTVIYLKVENRIKGGNFCADKNIFIIYPDGSRSLLVSSNGIPVCPDKYKFIEIGEKLDFVLTFPPLKKNTDWIDLVEECSENCFSFCGIILDNNLNKKIDAAFRLVDDETPSKALVSFLAIGEEIANKNLGAEGLVCLNIIKLAKETGDTAKVAEWYRRLESSGAPWIQLYIKHLNSQGIKY